MVIYLIMTIDYSKIYYNSILTSIILWCFMSWLWRVTSYKILLVVLPIIFSERIFENLDRSSSASTFYSMIGDNLDFDIRKEIFLKSETTRLAIIYGLKNDMFDFKGNGFFVKDVFPWKQITRSKALKKYIKASTNLWKIMRKLRDDEEILYHLSKF